MAKEAVADIGVLAKQNIHPIVEFFDIARDENSDTSFINISDSDGKLLRNHLRNAKGIYSFYNSEYEIIYLGKTKNNLWNEMKNAYRRKMNHYYRYSVKHPRNKYKSKTTDLRRLSSRQMYVCDAATYFSAYHIDDDNLIDLIELMMIRMMPNDILNVRMEGNMTLQTFASVLGSDA